MVHARKRSLIGLLVIGLLVIPLVASAFAGGGILFGLATAPGGDILVADATVGILRLQGDRVTSTIALPGVTDVSPIGSGSMWAVTGAGDAGPNTDSGQALYRVSNGRAELIVNLWDFEESENPAPPAEVPDSNPFDVQSLGGNAALVVDAGGNDLLRIDRRGGIEVLATFPGEVLANPPIPFPFPIDAVPTSVAIGPGGYYVGELKGFPSPVGESRIWRISEGATGAECPNPNCVEVVFDDAFTSIIDLAIGPDGNLYVVELDEAGWLAMETGAGVGGTINACDLRTLVCSEVATGINQVTAITFDRGGNLWATRNAVTFGEAEVIPIG